MSPEKETFQFQVNRYWSCLRDYRSNVVFLSVHLFISHHTLYEGGVSLLFVYCQNCTDWLKEWFHVGHFYRCHAIYCALARWFRSYLERNRFLSLLFAALVHTLNVIFKTWTCLSSNLTNHSHVGVSSVLFHRQFKLCWTSWEVVSTATYLPNESKSLFPDDTRNVISEWN